jgi:uroporphyrinogen decarboxylase
MAKFLSKRERVIKTLNCEPVDRPPIYDLIRNDELIEFFTGRKLTVENGINDTLFAISQFLDATKQFIRFPQEERRENGIEYKRWTSWKLKEYNDSIKLIQKVKDYIFSWKGWNENQQKILEDQLADLSWKQSRVGDTVIFLNGWMGGVYSFADFVGGWDNFSYLLADEPKLVREGLEVMFQVALEQAQHLPNNLSTPAVFVGEDIAYRNGPIVSPEFLKKEFMPRLKKIVDVYHSKGLKVIFHSDGNLWPIMDYLVDCGIDALNPIESSSGMDIGELRKKYPNLVLIGGIDCNQLLPFGPPYQIRQSVRKAIEESKYGYFVGSSSEIHNEIPLVNILAMYTEVLRCLEK